MTEGFLNLLKPPGMTSHDVIGAVRRIFGIKRVGHAGTLDPGAAGILPVAVGRAARLIEYLADCDKAYRTELILGYATDTGDDTGKVVERRENFRMPSEDEIREVLKRFTGRIRQVPPKYSAVKIGGKRACDLARAAQEVEIPEREVEISRLELKEVRPGKLFLEAECSKGTYIRTLCADIGMALGIPATMGFLLRTRVGDFRLEDAVILEELRERKEEALLAPEACLSTLFRYDLPEHRKKAFCNGLSTNVKEEHLPKHFRVYCGEEFLGIGGYRSEEKSIIPIKVY